MWCKAVSAGIRTKDRDRRSNAARIRQGEWFFVPATKARVERFFVLRNEPIARGGGKPHVCEESCIALAGRRFMSTPWRPQTVSRTSNIRLFRKANGVAGIGESCVATRRCMCAAGCAISTTRLCVGDGWHEVLSNTENLSHAMRNVAFLDLGIGSGFAGGERGSRYFAPNESTR